MMIFFTSLAILALPSHSMAQELGARCQELQLQKKEASENYRRASTGQDLACGTGVMDAKRFQKLYLQAVKKGQLPAVAVPASCPLAIQERETALEREKAAYRAFEACNSQN